MVTEHTDVVTAGYTGVEVIVVTGTASLSIRSSYGTSAGSHIVPLT